MYMYICMSIGHELKTFFLQGHADTCQFQSKTSGVEILNQKIRKLEEDIRKLQDENAEVSKKSF